VYHTRMVNTAGGIVIAVVVILLAAGIAWIIFTQLRARRLGVRPPQCLNLQSPLHPPKVPSLTFPCAQLPPPTLADYIPFYKSPSSSGAGSYGPPRPAPGGAVGWFNDQIRKFKNRNNRSATGAYEQPLQSGGPRRGFGPLDPDEAWDARVGVEADSYYEERAHDTGYAGAQGRADDSYALNLAGPYGRDDDDEDRGRRGRAEAGGRANPFDDDAEASLRGVSPRPMEGGQPRASNDTRRSAFREDV
jgi:hypothetical protein